jgi:hypothetical protein
MRFSSSSEEGPKFVVFDKYKCLKRTEREDETAKKCHKTVVEALLV